MATIKTNFGSGGAGLTPGGSSGSPDLATILRDIADDLAAIKTAYNNTLAKLDADAGVTDTNYAATNPVGTLLTQKG